MFSNTNPLARTPGTSARSVIAGLATEAGPFYADDDARDVYSDLRSVSGDPDDLFTIADVRSYLRSLPA
jgi:hypothetical protein